MEEQEMQRNNRFKSGLIYFRDVLAKTTNGMAIGLFGTLIIGTIINLFSKIPHLEAIATWANFIMSLMGAGIGLGVALALKRKAIIVVTATVCGALGNFAFLFWNGTMETFSDPLSCYVSVMLALLVIKLVFRKSTPFDLIIIPLLGIGVSLLYSFLLSHWVHQITIFISMIIDKSTNAVPLLMAFIISVLVGMALTAPISSVAICSAISIGGCANPVASIAALIGCCTQMVGFAVHTARDNKVGGVLAVGLGTSMLQFKNIVKKPLIWTPTIIVSFLLAPLALTFSKGWLDPNLFVNGEASLVPIRTLSVAAGMGTSGLVGPINLFTVSNVFASSSHWWVILWAFGVLIVAPALLTFGIDLLYRRLGWIKEGDFSLTSDI